MTVADAGARCIGYILDRALHFQQIKTAAAIDMNRGKNRQRSAIDLERVVTTLAVQDNRRDIGVPNRGAGGQVDRRAVH